MERQESCVKMIVKLCGGKTRVMCQDDCEMMWKDKNHVSG